MDVAGGDVISFCLGTVVSGRVSVCDAVMLCAILFALLVVLEHTSFVLLDGRRCGLVHVRCVR
jgi:hypothetical protein